jgi:hypothetical protein
MTTGEAAAVGEVVARVRRLRRRNSRSRTSDRLIDGYSAVLTAFLGGTVVASVLDADLEPHPGLVVDMALWLPVVLLLAVWATLRFATWQGPVLFSPADLQTTSCATRATT